MNLTELFAPGSGGAPYVATVLLVLKATAILLAAVAIATGLRRASAGTRHLVWLVAIGAVLALPALAGWTPLDLPILPAARTSDVVSPFVASIGSPDLDASSGEEDSGAPLNGGASPIGAAAEPVGMAAAGRALPLGSVLIAIWGAVAALLIGRLIHGTLAVRRIVRRATPLADEDWQGRLYDVADRLGIARAPRVLSSDQIHVPFAAGMVRATIVLPAECDGWTPGQRDAVLIHELGHVRRHDLLGHTLGRVACALYWFHPLVWTAARRLRDASERACDDLAIRLGSRPSEYAEHLLLIVTAAGRPAVPGVALAMAQRKEFEGRMLAILDPALRRDAPARWQAVSLTGALVMLSLLVAAAAPAPGGEPGTAGAPIPDQFSADRTADGFPDDEPDDDPDDDGAQDAEPDARYDAGYFAEHDAEPEDRYDALPMPDARPDARPEGRTRIDAAAFDRSQSTPAASARSNPPNVLARILRTDSSAHVRRVAAWGLRQHIDVPVAAQALSAAAADDADPGVRRMAIWALEDSRDAAVVPVIGEVLRRDDDADVRETAAWALGQINDPAGAAFLTAQLDGEVSDAVLATIAWALGRTSPERAPVRLQALLTSPSPKVRLMTAWALSEIADPAALPAVRTAIRQPQEASTMRALVRAWVAVDSSPEGLRDLLDSADPEVRSIAVRALAGNHRLDPWPWPWPRVIISP